LRSLTAVFLEAHSIRRNALALCLFMICGATAAQAQTPAATLSGIVKDTRGAFIQGAKVLLTSVAQGTVRESSTNSDVSYSIPDLLPGAYRADVSSSGFATAQYSNVVLEAGRTFTLDATLSPASQVTTVNVTAAAQTVDLAQS